MEKDDFVEFKNTILNRIIYTYHPIMTLPKGGSLEWYEEGEWIPARERKIGARDESGFDVIEFYEKWIVHIGYEDRILSYREMKRWAMWVEKSVFTLLGLSITALSIITKMPFWLVGVLMSLLSLYLKYIEVSKPPFPQPPTRKTNEVDRQTNNKEERTG